MIAQAKKKLIDPLLARQFDQLPPHDMSAEYCAVGSMMLCGDDEAMFFEIVANVSPEDFYDSDVGTLARVMIDMRRNGKPVDAVLLHGELTKRGIYEQLGGREFIASILGSVPSAAHGAHYAQTVRENAILRRIISHANDALRRAYGWTMVPGNPVNSRRLAADMAASFSELAASTSACDVKSIGDICAEVYDRLGGADTPRIATGLVELDDIIGGLPFGKMTFVGARPAMGKSQLCKQIGRNIAGQDIRVGLVTIEETNQKIGENTLAALSGIENNRIAYNRVGEHEYSALAAGVKLAAKLPFFVNDKPVKLRDVEAAINTLAVRHHCRVIFVDYLQLIDGGIENENREITTISKTLKSAFKRLDVAGVCCVQLNRGNEQSHGVPPPPTLKNLRGSGSLEQDGDLILMLHREDYYRKHEENFSATQQLEVFIEKNKDGNVGRVPLYFSGRTQEVLNWGAQYSFTSNAVVQVDGGN